MISGHSDPARPDSDAPSTGTDPTDSVSVTIDSSRRVVQVEVMKASGVDTPEALDSCVTGAYRAAVAARRPKREAGGRRERPVAVATLAVAPPRTPESYDRHQIRDASRADRARRRAHFGPRVGQSANECITVTLPPASSLGRVDADAGWLMNASSTAIARSVTEAFLAAYSERDDR